jgi:hypothetical protein
MRTIYLGDTYARRPDNKRLSSRDIEQDPRGDDIPVFDRYASGGRGDYERPWRYDEDHVQVRRIKPWQR